MSTPLNNPPHVKKGWFEFIPFPHFVVSRYRYATQQPHARAVKQQNTTTTHSSRHSPKAAAGMQQLLKPHPHSFNPTGATVVDAPMPASSVAPSKAAAPPDVFATEVARTTTEVDRAAASLMHRYRGAHAPSFWARNRQALVGAGALGVAYALFNNYLSRRSRLSSGSYVTRGADVAEHTR